MAKDWVGNQMAMFATLGASSHSENDRAFADYYATPPQVVEELLKREKFCPYIWEPAVGGGHIADVLKKRCNAFESDRPMSTPMSFWTEQDVLMYLKTYNVPYCSVYGNIITDTRTGKLRTTGCSRTGCYACMFGCHLEKPENRFQMMKRTHPKLYNYCINGGEFVDGIWQPNKLGLGLGKVLDYIGVDYIPEEDRYAKLFE